MDTLFLAKPSATIAQLSDLHLTDTNSQEKFTQVLTLACSHSPDLLLLTGDLVNDGQSAGYDWLFDVLAKTGIPFVCMAGNHDVTAEIGHELPFHMRTFLPIKMDDRLAKNQRLPLALSNSTWQILAIESAVSGQIHGHVSLETLQFLKTHLQNAQPTIIALHHHPHPVGSAWIDAHILQNHDEFWRTFAPFDNVQAVLCGHVHQAHEISVHGKKLYTCPAVSRQFAPHRDDFALDEIAAGFRLIHICNKNQLETCVKRVQN